MNKRMRYLTWAFITGLSLFFATRGSPASLFVRAIMFLFFFVFMMCVAWVFEYLLGRIAQWRLLTPGRYQSLLCRHSITLADDALIEVTPVSEGRSLWQGIHQIVNAPEYIYVFLTAQSAHVIPKRAFPNAAVAQQFYERAVRLRETHVARAADMIAP